MNLSRNSFAKRKRSSPTKGKSNRSFYPSIDNFPIFSIRNLFLSDHSNWLTTKKEEKMKRSRTRFLVGKDRPVLVSFFFSFSNSCDSCFLLSSFFRSDPGLWGGDAFLPNASLEITEIREILSPYEKTSSIRAPTKVLARSRFAYVRNDQKYMYIYIIYNISFLI